MQLAIIRQLTLPRSAHIKPAAPRGSTGRALPRQRRLMRGTTWPVTSRACSTACQGEPLARAAARTRARRGHCGVPIDDA